MMLECVRDEVRDICVCVVKRMCGGVLGVLEKV